MASASLIRFACFRWILLTLLFAPAGLAQELWPGMEGYLKLTLRPAGGDKNTVLVTNLYASGLVALYWDYYKCPGGVSAANSGKTDLALGLGNPLAQGQTLQAASAETGCSGGITAAIFADGKELGEPETLGQIHSCRSAAAEEIHRTFEEDISTVPQGGWDPASSIAKLKARRSQFPMYLYTDNPREAALQACRTVAIDYLRSSMESYRASVTSDPAKYGPRRGMFLQYLKEIEQALRSRAYPTRRTWWMAP